MSGDGGGLSGTILVTGASGFLGKAVLSALLGRLPDSGRILVLLRAPDDDAAARRLAEEVLANEAFDGLAAESRRRLLAEHRLVPLAGDLREGRLPGSDLLAGIDTVIHCAASVSFEEPLDDALALNAFGPRRLLQALHESGSRPHFVHVSTAYVTDHESGVVSEDGTHAAVPQLDPGELVELGREWRETVESESRRPRRLRRLAHEANRDVAHRPQLDATEHAEALRRRWVGQGLARLGRRHAASLGFPDTYALSKALGERLLSEHAERATIVRPSIIESAVSMPRPGWLEGIKVADPLILAYAARGLTHLPARADNRIDIVPVDFVAHACVAAAAHPPAERLRVLALTSSARNPLRIGELAAHTRAYFSRDPLTRRDGSEIEIGDLHFVERKVALRRTIRREQLVSAGARLFGLLPVRLGLERDLRKNSYLASRVTRMVKIYGAYTELDCIFDDANTAAFLSSLPEAERAALPFDIAQLDWEEYLQRIHLPEVREIARRD
jgi:alcohol-forming fatty acyl-CoA reductase